VSAENFQRKLEKILYDPQIDQKSNTRPLEMRAVKSEYENNL
jgi:hypothetical protein